MIIAPWLSVVDATAAVAFYKAAFDAAELYLLEEGGVVAVAQLSIGGADVWLSDDPDSAPVGGKAGAVRMIVTVDDPDSLFDQVVAAGAKVVAAIHEDFGWRIGRVVDPFGHHWEIGKQL